jgi:hypothetical protein
MAQTMNDAEKSDNTTNSDKKNTQGMKTWVKNQPMYLKVGVGLLAGWIIYKFFIKR